MDHTCEQACLPTLFAPAERATAEELAAQIARVAGDPLVTRLMLAAGGMFAVLNARREVVAANLELLRALGVEDPGDVLGLRPGEALGCAHAYEAAGGCGTGSFCSTCGAAISILASLRDGQADERDCAISLDRHGQLEDRIFRVRCAPLAQDGHDLVLLTLRDVSDEHWRAALERVFLHDVNNAVSSLLGTVDLLESTSERDQALIEQVARGARRVAREVEAHRCLRAQGAGRVTVRTCEEGCARIAASLCELFSNHALARGRTLALVGPVPARPLTTDPLLVERVLANMVSNALEATAEGGRVELRVAERDGGVAFSVWNAGRIDPAARKRLFQRHFSTKPGAGRGFGTFSMRLFGEMYLKGRVGFESGEAGTIFSLWLPWAA